MSIVHESQQMTSGPRPASVLTVIGSAVLTVLVGMVLPLAGGPATGLALSFTLLRHSRARWFVVALGVLVSIAQAGLMLGLGGS